MARMTEQEAWDLDDLVTNTKIEIGPNGTDFLAQREARLMGLDNLSINYLMTRAKADNKTPAEIIGEMIRERIAAAV